MMKITTANGPLSIPEDFSFTVKATHPFFSKEGTATIPLQIPLDDNNRMILGFPDIPTRGVRMNRKMAVIVSYGTVSRKGKLLIESIEDNSINACIALDESELYATTKALKIQDVMAGETIVAMHPNGILSPTALYRRGITFENLAFFPVVTDFDQTTGKWSGLNIPNLDGSRLDDTPGQITVEGETINAPAGYGLAPFILLAPVVRMIFEKCGYRVIKSCLEDDIALSSIILLHSVADSICDGYSLEGRSWHVEISDLLPSITVGELIEWLRNKLGILVLRKDEGIEIVRFSEMAEKPVTFDLSDFIIEQESISYPSPKSLKLEMSEGDGPRTPAAEDILALKKKYPQVQSAMRLADVPSSGSGLYYIKGTGALYHVDGGIKKFIGSDAYPYNRHVASEGEVISTSDMYVPGVIAWHGHHLPYVGTRRHIFLQEKKTDEDQPIMICYLIRWTTTFETAPHQYTEEDRLSGCSHPYDPVGRPAPFLDGAVLPSLTPEGLHGEFREYEEILANGAPEFKVSALLSLNTIMATDWRSPILYHGSKVIVKEMSYAVGVGWETAVAMTLQLIPAYEDAVTIPEISFTDLYRWAVKNSKPAFRGITIMGTDGIPDYTPADAPITPPNVLGQRVKVRDRWIKIRHNYAVNPVTKVYQYKEWFEVVE